MNLAESGQQEQKLFRVGIKGIKLELDTEKSNMTHHYGQSELLSLAGGASATCNFSLEIVNKSGK